ncbi:zinc finger FYVE domain-containing protein 9 isoform X2 [Anthonomus grandis grandis]|uniref:zinc finger FYVE domain-containing protein 9 isoform X2 n=1 Tax=Anthonomus grandis grandis TaxID=2921223 RepID=UPI0021651004|nr:zinc finger FYVE domain-containing protein 9 isoform X2 [Anthonomus grandis grandis]
MDKYTVDLDQVLNDFEYYELTDQHSKNVPEKAQNNNVQYQPPPVTAKHSINNVFHSLNEYLNSSVGVEGEHAGSSFPQENKIGENDNNFGELNTNAVNNKTIFDKENEEKIDVREDPRALEGEKETLEPAGIIEEVEAPEIVNDVNIPNECDSSVTEQTDSLLEQEEKPNFMDNCEKNLLMHPPISKVIGAIENQDTILIDLTEAPENIQQECSSDVLNNKVPHDFIIEPSESFMQGDSLIETKNEDPINVKEIPENVENQTESFTDDDVGTVEVPDENEDISNKVEPDSSSLTVKEDPPTMLNVENCQENCNPETIEDSVKELEVEDVVVEEVTPTEPFSKEEDFPVKTEETSEAIPEQPKPVTFYVENIDIDESELNKMLEDLELEEDENNENITPPKEVDDKQDKSVDGDQIGASQEMVQLVNNASDLVENEPGAVTEKEPKIIECLEVEKPKRVKSSIKVKKNQEVGEAALVEEPKQEEGTKELGEGGSESKETSEEAQSRPDTLPLNNELAGDEKTGRKINLIGSPGSTPYNNVYVNKSIKKPKVQDVESTDYTSCSASPTFSDCSTESTSTASTVSVEDDPNNSERFVKKTPKVKNVNIENEVARLQGIGGQQQKNAESQDSNEPTQEQAEDGTATSTEPENPETLNNAGTEGQASNVSQFNSQDKSWLGKEAPLWIPDADTSLCLHCDMKFTIVKRRHHCRACGLVLCSKCCNLKHWLEYLDAEARVCNKCYEILSKDRPNNASSSNTNSPETENSPFRPNPNNPLEYCSTVSPLQQAGQTAGAPPSVMVPVGVLKRKGSNKKSNKSVMFCDGIAPGSDLTNLDQDFNYNKPPGETKKIVEPVAPVPPVVDNPVTKPPRNQTKIDKETGCYIPKCETNLPPTISRNKTDISYTDCSNTPSVVEMLKNEKLTFAITQNLFVHVKIINMKCCINKEAWCFASDGLINVGSDEVVYLIEYIEEESFVPKDVFFHIYNVYIDAVKGRNMQSKIISGLFILLSQIILGISIKELGLSLHDKPNFLDSRNHAGFVYIKPSFQCLENVIVPKEPYLVGILIHRWETPWAKLFPLRLILRLGAEYRYYPSPLISTRHRDSVFVEIGHTIINLLADFRNFSYTLPQIRGLVIHMEDKKTTITIPKNRYDQVIKSITNSSEHILAFAGNFSTVADSHLVCIQDTQGHENSYATHAINIHNKPRKVTGACFIVFNGSLKSSSGLTAKSNIVEDGLMIQVPSEHMDKLRENLRLMKDHSIACGCVNAETDETVNIIWGENDTDFNNGVKSPVDDSDMKGIPSIRVHNGKDFVSNNGARLIRWTEVFIIQSGEENSKNQDPVDISKVSESIARACCTALVKYLDLLVTNSCNKIGVRTTLHVENVSYSAGSNGTKLTPIYMRSLDNELIPVLHRITSSNLGDSAIVLELIFRILNA